MELTTAAAFWCKLVMRCAKPEAFLEAGSFTEGPTAPPTPPPPGPPAALPPRGFLRIISPSVTPSNSQISTQNSLEAAQDQLEAALYTVTDARASQRPEQNWIMNPSLVGAAEAASSAKVCTLHCMVSQNDFCTYQINPCRGATQVIEH